MLHTLLLLKIKEFLILAWQWVKLEITQNVRIVHNVESIQVIINILFYYENHKLCCLYSYDKDNLPNKILPIQFQDAQKPN